MKFGERLRELRREKRFTLRALADAAGLSFTYLSKIENGRLPYTPAADKIRLLAGVLEVDALELLRLADKVPPELADVATDAKARIFLERAREVASPEDWSALLDLLEQRQEERTQKRPE